MRVKKGLQNCPILWIWVINRVKLEAQIPENVKNRGFRETIKAVFHKNFSIFYRKGRLLGNSQIVSEKTDNLTKKLENSNV